MAGDLPRHGIRLQEEKLSRGSLAGHSRHHRYPRAAFSAAATQPERASGQAGDPLTPAAWLWIPVTIWAAFAQTIRNAVQRGLTAELGTLGATLVRFLYGLPFAALWLLFAAKLSGSSLP